MTLDDVQVVFAHLQPSLIAGSGTTEPDRLARAAAALGRTAARLRLPMTFGMVPEGDRDGRPIPELDAFATTANSSCRHGANLLLDPPIAAAIAANHRGTLALAGFAAEVVVLHTALAALEAGYAVQVLVDAVGGHSDRTEQAALRQIKHAGGVITSFPSLFSALAQDFTTPFGTIVLNEIKAWTQAS